MKYAYPAIFEADGEGYTVSFPDLPGCITEGDSVEDAVYMAHDALCLWLYDKEVDNKAFPPASNPADVALSADGFLSVVAVDTDEYRRYYDTTPVKKTLTIPAWLNAAALERNVNFSQVLQDALKQHLQI